MTIRWRCEHAAVAGRAERDVVVTVDDGRISAVDVGGAPAGDEVRLDGLVLPGFANVHSHAFHRRLRGRTQAGRGSFWTWRDQMYAAAAALDPDGYHEIARRVFGEMVRCGYTAVGEFHYVHHRPDGTPYDDPNAMGHAVAATAADTGIRLTLLDTIYLRGGLSVDGVPLPLQGPQVRYADRGVDAFLDRVTALEGTLPAGCRLGVAAHSVRAVDVDDIERVSAWAADRTLPFHVHVSEQPAENVAVGAAYGTSPTGALADALGPHATVIHATHLTDDDIAALAASGATVCFCPTTEADLGDGIGPSGALAAAGVPLALGSDSHAVIDPFAEMRSLELHQRLRAIERGIHSGSELLTIATANGHRSLGWPDAGELAVGQRADLVAVRLDSDRTADTWDDETGLLDAIVFSATAADVTTVIVDGDVRWRTP